MRALTAPQYRVYADCCQGGRKYMEDCHCIAFQEKARSSPLSNDASDDRLQYAFFGVFDGHGGKEAALFTKDNLLRNIVSQRGFWSRDDHSILSAIKHGFIATHYAMMKEVSKWPKTSTGLPSTSGTTASVCFVMNNKYYIGHVGDSKIVLVKKRENTWIAMPLTDDHKPDSPLERERILNAGGKIVNKSGIERVVWNRPKCGHKGPIRRSTHFDEIPFLAVARSLGDLWSYNSSRDIFIVSPEPDVSVVPILPHEDKCIVLASDGLWNMLMEQECALTLQEIEENVDNYMFSNSLFNSETRAALNPSQALVQFALQRWYSNNLRADNTSVIVVFLDNLQTGTSGNNHTDYELWEEKLKNMSDEEFSALNWPTIVSASNVGEYLIDASKPHHNQKPSNFFATKTENASRNSSDFKLNSSFTNLQNASFDFTRFKNHNRNSLPETFYSAFLVNDVSQKPLQTINDNESNCKITIQEVNAVQEERRTRREESDSSSAVTETREVQTVKALKSSFKIEIKDCEESENKQHRYKSLRNGNELKLRSKLIRESRKFRNGKITKRKTRELSTLMNASPPSKRLRSSNWSRAKVVLPSNLTRTLAASLLTRSRSRLRAIKCITKDAK